MIIKGISIKLFVSQHKETKCKLVLTNISLTSMILYKNSWTNMWSFRLKLNQTDNTYGNYLLRALFGI
jgi:hypothetical protein